MIKTVDKEIIELFELTPQQIKRVEKKLEELNAENEKKTIKFTLFDEPIHAQRPRVGKFGNMYVPGASSYKKKYKPIIQELLPKDFNAFKTACTIKMDVFRKSLTTFSKTDEVLAEMKVIRPMTTPDIDNRVKPYMDICKDIIYHDDGQVVGLDVQEYYSINPRVEITVEYDTTFMSSKFKK